MAEMLDGGIVPGLTGAFVVWLFMFLAKLWSIEYGDKNMWDEIWDRMEYLTGHMNNENP